MFNVRSRIRVLSVIALFLGLALPGSAKSSAYQTAFTAWRAADGDFVNWSLNGTAIDTDGAILLQPDSAQAGTDPYAAGEYYGGNFYNAGSFIVGEATSPAIPASFSFSEAIASWNAETPPGSWIETQIRAELGGRWTKWYNLGIWAADGSTIERHSVRLQGDNDGFVAVDTLILTNKKEPATAYQLKVRLFSEDGAALPRVNNLSVATSTSAPKDPTVSAGNPAYWAKVLDVPECSQMVYSDGGEIWCSPTSTSMVLSYWADYNGPCEPQVRAAVAGVYDWIYEGHGNWPFNTAYAATQGHEAYVARFSSLAQAEAWIAAGVPVIVSFAWSKGELTGAAIPSSAGHLAVLVGFDANGNPILNDPAAAADEDVQRTYLRSEFEPLWLEHSGGTVYLIYPQDAPTPSL